MTRPTPRRAIGPKLSLALTSALAGVLLAGCTTQAAPPATLSATKAEQALASGKHSQAIEHAEAAVLAEPHNAEYRSILASAYLDAGRFASAETTYKDAMQLGDQSPRNALSLALALSAQGKYPDAAALLNQWEGRIATSDLGLALALAGQPERGIHLMSNAIRSGENTAKMRQNLAYSYALAGRWREARLMAEQDVPADQVGDRIEQWAAMAAPEAWHVRIASLLDVPAHAADAGQPVQLALANTPSIDQLAAEATALAAVDVPEPAPLAAVTPGGELPALAAPAQPSFEAAFATPAPAPAVPQAPRVAQAPVAQPAPAPRNGAVTAAAAQRAEGTHLIQLGSFSSEQGARRAWSVFTKRYPALSGHEMVISEAVVRGKRYWRVSAAGFARSSAASM
ncbi:MAG TPA: tetratricopeptide repeat protein, partial [Croceibacterium sp.]|nr:tetratricopeptide repeat protein [Croceibacterium sp.]